MTTQMERQRTLGNDEAARYIGIQPSTLRTWVSRRKVPYCRVGRLVRFRIGDLDRFLESGLIEVDTKQKTARTVGCGG
jgi:excisionase family DNA binding protein